MTKSFNSMKSIFPTKIYLIKIRIKPTTTFKNLRLNNFINQKSTLKKYLQKIDENFISNYY